MKIGSFSPAISWSRYFQGCFCELILTAVFSFYQTVSTIRDYICNCLQDLAKFATCTIGIITGDNGGFLWPRFFYLFPMINTTGPNYEFFKKSSSSAILLKLDSQTPASTQYLRSTPRRRESNG